MSSTTTLTTAREREREKGESEIESEDTTTTDEKVLREPREQQRPIKEFQSEGFVTVPNLLSKDTCTKLRQYILQDLESVLDANEKRKKQDGYDDVNDGNFIFSERFSMIRQRTNRWDFKLEAPPNGIVRRAMKEILSLKNDISSSNTDDCNTDGEFLRQVLVPMLDDNVDSDSSTFRKEEEGATNHIHDNKFTEVEDAILCELGALVSDPGAPAQEWHPDLRHMGAASNGIETQMKDGFVICVFVPLQYTPTSMGPTQILSSTHTKEFHHSAMANFPCGVLPSMYPTRFMRNGFEQKGDGCIMDTRVYHRGGANNHNHNINKHHTDADEDEEKSSNTCSSEEEENPNRRVVFYFSYKSSEKYVAGLGDADGYGLKTIMPGMFGMQLEHFTN
jgi:hypothetical protein